MAAGCVCQVNGMADDCTCRCHDVLTDAWAEYVTEAESKARIEDARRCAPRPIMQINSVLSRLETS